MFTKQDSYLIISL